jgi:ribonuclease BN (tRNA processing enzyme)
MRVRILGCSGAIARDCRTTAFLLDHDLLIDAGTGVGDLSLEEMAQVQHVLLTHSHLDHIAALPLLIDSVASRRIGAEAGPSHVHALPETIAALRAHIFNDLLWPDFSVIPTAAAPLLRFSPIRTGQVLQIGRHQVEVLPAVHTVPAVGFAVSGSRGQWVFSGDTGPNPDFWARINQIDVAMLVIETAFSNREQALAEVSKHLAPVHLSTELDRRAQGRSYPIYITHTKPAETGRIMAEIAPLSQPKPDGSALAIHWLSAGQVFEV